MPELEDIIRSAVLSVVSEAIEEFKLDQPDEEILTIGELLCIFWHASETAKARLVNNQGATAETDSTPR